MEIKNHYHKYVVCYDSLACGNGNEIEIVNIVAFSKERKLVILLLTIIYGTTPIMLLWINHSGSKALLFLSICDIMVER